MQTRRRPAWVYSEGPLLVAVSLISIVLTSLVLLLLAWMDPRVLDIFSWLAVTVVWTAFAATHAVLTWWAFAGLEGAELEAALRIGQRHQRRQRERSRLTRAAMGHFGPWPVQVSAMALVVVAGFVVAPALRVYVVLLVFALLMVAASWVDVALAYAVDYARAELAEPGLDFPGEEERAFSDYLYFALGVQATFGATDVTVTTRRVRRVVTMHSAVAFVFNTVLVGMIVSLLLGLA